MRNLRGRLYAFTGVLAAESLAGKLGDGILFFGWFMMAWLVFATAGTGASVVRWGISGALTTFMIAIMVALLFALAIFFFVDPSKSVDRITAAAWIFMSAIIMWSMFAAPSALIALFVRRFKGPQAQR